MPHKCLVGTYSRLQVHLECVTSQEDSTRPHAIENQQRGGIWKALLYTIENALKTHAKHVNNTARVLTQWAH